MVAAQVDGTPLAVVVHPGLVGLLDDAAAGPNVPSRHELAGLVARIGREQCCKPAHRQARHIRDIESLKLHRQRLAGRRLPLQSGQASLTMNRAARRFIIALVVVAKLCVTWRRALENVPM